MIFATAIPKMAVGKLSRNNRGMGSGIATPSPRLKSVAWAKALSAQAT